MAIKVYYVDDEPDLLDLFADVFSSDDVEVTTFVDPDTALSVIWEAPPDLLFLDYRLPKTTGSKLACEIEPAIPKVLITGDLATTRDANFIGVFSKPLNFEEISAFIASFVDRTSRGEISG